jgi:hypothetical protein
MYGADEEPITSSYSWFSIRITAMWVTAREETCAGGEALVELVGVDEAAAGEDWVSVVCETVAEDPPQATSRTAVAPITATRRLINARDSTARQCRSRNRSRCGRRLNTPHVREFRD